MIASEQSQPLHIGRDRRAFFIQVPIRPANLVIHKSNCFGKAFHGLNQICSEIHETLAPLQFLIVRMVRLCQSCQFTHGLFDTNIASTTTEMTTEHIEYLLVAFCPADDLRYGRYNNPRSAKPAL